MTNEHNETKGSGSTAPEEPKRAAAVGAAKPAGGDVRRSAAQVAAKVGQTATKVAEQAKDEITQAGTATVQAVQQGVADAKAKHEAHEAFHKAMLEETRDTRKIALIARIYGVLVALVGLATIPFMALLIMHLFRALRDGEIGEEVKSLTFILECVDLAMQTVSAIFLVVFGIVLLLNKRRYALNWTYVLIPLTIIEILLSIALRGFDLHLILPTVQLVILVVISINVDPDLRAERQMERALQRMNREQHYEKALAEGMAGRDLSGKGYMTLNFFNIFWMFVAASVFGLVIETIFHLIVFGQWQDRAGMLWGPFSPIYGFGAVLMTVFLNHLYKSSPLLIFCASAVIGGAFEYFTSWFMQTAFGITAWNYSNEWGNIDGRTSVMFMAMWGLLGMVWVKWLLPPLLKLIQMIPWKVRYWLTAVCFVLILIDGVMTLMALDAWFGRMAGLPQTSPVAKFFAHYFDDQFMQNRFQTMTLNPKSASRY
ncbi:putative ABC transporter permease [Bifidobacterium gallicum]|uniref:Membrane protein n=1 Tax=Bifidobacterium gallicum DSM 20093 = LMG 11596 TaxID=561180 RepID=D1NW07_9BIFI|nr:putative ABC transporter permease [Bifidobacterium gallicum]EFA22293.1 hypothetical protein BIFGAL_04052 [Bifidobacterium gallicum DSM 20093 = LMG 11596]KFI60020.1 membrane protein [Bifidobacterium gallicum DSM 20093 = LMG 11596]